VKKKTRRTELVREAGHDRLSIKPGLGERGRVHRCASVQVCKCTGVPAIDGYSYFLPDVAVWVRLMPRWLRCCAFCKAEFGARWSDDMTASLSRLSEHRRPLRLSSGQLQLRAFTARHPGTTSTQPHLTLQPASRGVRTSMRSMNDTRPQ
jgi:hypothetical protein